ncbi:hypothetical protein VA602_08825 [Pseudomonas sp. MH2]|uniref:Uncharacterized protein n=1 Tax=Pseudomonas machongensis TaxID=3110229 RepID=A0ABU5VHD3_9PSED|nr:hypothetical protein [Pseudomonas sp. MH2]MEA5671445.1 hypothetical protein [Pseudomonas sp. MH2]
MSDQTLWLTTAPALGNMLAAVVTAIATIFLWRVTKLLAKETTRMVEAADQPHVVAILSRNRWSVKHFDLVVENTGNATAYDIKISFNPPLENGEARRQGAKIPFEQVSVLKPGQELRSYLADITLLEGKSFEVTISWRHGSKERPRETNSYTLNMADYKGVSELGQDPVVDMARSLERMEKNLSSMVRSKHLKVDVYTSDDRAQERQKAMQALNRIEDKRTRANTAQELTENTTPGISS